MIIISQRLIVRALTYGQVIKYLQNDGSLEKELTLNIAPRSVDPELREAVESVLLPNIAELCTDVLYSTIWTVIDTEKNVMVADLCFYGEPNKKGEVEIGYGTYPQYQAKGYMTEAVGIMVRWAEDREEVKVIKARNEKENEASAKVLERNNFKIVAETEDLFYWERAVK